MTSFTTSTQDQTEVSDFVKCESYLFPLSMHCAIVMFAQRHVQIRGSAHVALVRREGEDRDGDLLLRVRLLLEVRPLHRALRELLDAVRLRDGPAGDAVAAGEDDGLDRTCKHGARSAASVLSEELWAF